MHHLEGADFLGLDGDDDLLREELRRLVNLGVRGITPIYSNGNHFGGGSNEVGPDAEGLTPFGEELLTQMVEFGLLIDTAHMNVRTRGDVLRLLGGRVRLAYTHGGLEGIVQFESGRANERGIPLEQTEEIRRNGGIVGLSVSKPFVHSRSEFDVSLDILLASRFGSRGLGIGTDFGGVGQDEVLPGLTNHEDVLNHLLTRRSRSEIPAEAIDAIAFENALDVLHDVVKRRTDLGALRLRTT
jgi:membrane dipeptidase